MTLVEVLLALCLLVVLASITWPALDRPMATHRLRKAADLVRVEWSRARVKAMSTGETQVFRFSPETGRYAVEALGGMECTADAMGTSGGIGVEADAADQVTVTERELPDKILFVSGETAEDSRSLPAGTDDTELSAAENGWSDPIQFYVDGTATTATVVLKNEFDLTIELRLRGLTGQATVGKVKNAEGFVP